MTKHRPRIRKARHRNSSPQKAIVVGSDNGIEPVYYHGGAPRLKPGYYILPRAETGKFGFKGSQYNEGWAADWLEMKDDLEDEDWVFVTTNRLLASYYAIGNKSGADMLYAVQPEGTVERDPDRPIDCWRAERARIINVERVPYRFKQQVRSLSANVAHLSTISRLENAPSRTEVARLCAALLDQFSATVKPGELEVLDIDDTFCAAQRA